MRKKILILGPSMLRLAGCSSDDSLYKTKGGKTFFCARTDEVDLKASGVRPGGDAFALN